MSTRKKKNSSEDTPTQETDNDTNVPPMDEGTPEDETENKKKGVPPVEKLMVKQARHTITLRAGTILDGRFHPKGTVLEVTDTLRAQLKPFRYFG